jgi:hypothetical protein
LDSIKPEPQFNETSLRLFVFHVYGVPLSSISSDLTQLLLIAFKHIPKQEFESLALRYSFFESDNVGIKTLEAISVMVSPPVCRQTICVRIRRALRRLRSHAYSTNIRVYLKYLQDKSIS